MSLCTPLLLLVARQRAQLSPPCQRAFCYTQQGALHAAWQVDTVPGTYSWQLRWVCMVQAVACSV